jgi:hypothetical protein
MGAVVWTPLEITCLRRNASEMNGHRRLQRRHLESSSVSDLLEVTVGRWPRYLPI